MAQLRYVVLSIASAFLVLQLSEQVAADIGIATVYSYPIIDSECKDITRSDYPEDGFYAVAANVSSANIWSDGANCGKFLMVECIGFNCRGNERIKAKIVDRCPDRCHRDATFGLSPTAFLALASGGFEIHVEYSIVP